VGLLDTLIDVAKAVVKVVVDVVETIIGLLIDAVKDILENFGDNDVGTPKQPCPGKQAPPQLGILVVTVRRDDDGTTVQDATVRITGPQVREGRTDASGRVTFDNLPAGDYRIDAIKDGFKPGAADTTAAANTTRTADVVLGAQVLAITSIDSQFAPGVESLDITYNIRNMEEETVHLEISSDAHPSNPLFRRELTAAEKATGNGKNITWDGRCTSGGPPLAGKWADPAHSPYKVALVGGVHRDEKTTNVEINTLDLTPNTDPGNKVFMNNPAHKIDVTAQVSLKRKTGAAAVTPVEIKVHYTFSDPAPQNRAANQSFIYSGTSTLGKRGDAAAVYWEDHASCTSTSTDGYKLQCDVITVTAAGPTRGDAIIWFKPSGVGGDDFKLKAEVFAADGTTVLRSKESSTFTVWRRLGFAPYDMTGFTHVSTNGTTAIQGGFFTNATFVHYALGAVTTIPANRTVQFFGLWDHGSLLQLSWATHQAKTAAETPTAAEIAAASGAAGAARTAARAAITAKAQAWATRIATQYKSGANDWATDAGVPVNTVIGVQFFHPKFDGHAPGGQTTQWTAYRPWLSVTLTNAAHWSTYTGDPDGRWDRAGGFAYGNRAYIYTGTANARTRVVIAHEAGHESKQQFKRKLFGAGDHTSGSGLMDTTGSRNSFTNGERDILRGYR